MIKMVLVFLVALLAFSVGTFVGKKFSDQQHKTAAIENIGNQQRSTASISPESLEVKPNQALTDADIASITEEFATADKDDIAALLEDSKETTVVENENAKTMESDSTVKVEEMTKADVDMERKVANSEPTTLPKMDSSHTVKAPMPTKTKEKESATNNKNDEVKKAAERLSQNMAPTEKPKAKERIPTSLPKSVANNTIGKYTVQIAAYKMEDEALAQAKMLKEKGYNAFYIPVKVKGVNWYRVNVGLFESKSKANVYKKQLLKEAELKTAFVQEIVR